MCTGRTKKPEWIHTNKRRTNVKGSNKGKYLLRQGDKEEYQKTMQDNRGMGLTEKNLHGKLRRSTKAIADRGSRKGAEAIITAAQDHTLRTNLYQASNW